MQCVRVDNRNQPYKKTAIHTKTLPTCPTQASAATIPEDDPSYWLAVQRCVALGWLVPAADLIGLHTAWQRVQLGASADDAALAGQLQVLEALLILLRRMPALAAPGGAGEGLRRMAAAAGEGAAGEFVQKRCDGCVQRGLRAAHAYGVDCVIDSSCSHMIGRPRTPQQCAMASHVPPAP